MSSPQVGITHNPVLVTKGDPIRVEVRPAVASTGGGGVQSVTGDGVGGTAEDVVLTFPTPADIGAYEAGNPDGFVDSAGAAAAAPVQSVTGTLVTGTASDPVVDIPTAGDVGAIPTTEKGAANGVASLGADGKLAGAQIVGVYGSVLPLKGRYCRLGADGQLTVNIPANNILRLGQFSISYDTVIDQIGVSWDISGEAGSKVRIGVYGPLLPDMTLEQVPLLFDAGVVDGAQAAGQYYITIDQPLRAGIYFSATLNYDSPTTRPRMRTTSASMALPFGSFDAVNTFIVNQQVGFQATLLGGAFPATLAALTLAAERCNMVQARIKA